MAVAAAPAGEEPHAGDGAPAPAAAGSGDVAVGEAVESAAPAPDSDPTPTAAPVPPSGAPRESLLEPEPLRIVTLEDLGRLPGEGAAGGEAPDGGGEGAGRLGPDG